MMLEVSALWLVNKKKELLLAQRSLTKKFHPGEWGPTVTGTAELNETPEETLVREVEEELGLKLGDYKPEFLLKKDFMHADGRIRRFSVYFALVEDNITDKFKIDSIEVKDIRWLPLEKVKELHNIASDKFKIVPSAKKVWPETFSMLERHLLEKS